MENITLNGTWSLMGKSQCRKTENIISIDAQVPGCVQLDLSRAGYLPEDLFIGENILEAEKYEEYEWWYERKFISPKQRRNVYLVFEGVDCLAEYFLNGVKLGESKNMLIAHEFRVDDALCDGENVLTVHISSAMVYASSKDYPVRLLHSIDVDGCHLRKAPHSFGWDIMPRAVTAGLWRDVRLEVRDSIYFEQSFISTNNNSGTFYYVLKSDSLDLSRVEIELEGSCGDSKINAKSFCKWKCGKLNFTVNDPKLWFPYGYGDANVYDCKARIYENGTLIHETGISFGIRDVVLDRRDPDGSDSGQFRFLINGIYQYE